METRKLRSVSEGKRTPVGKENSRLSAAVDKISRGVHWAVMGGVLSTACAFDANGENIGTTSQALSEYENPISATFGNGTVTWGKDSGNHKEIIFSNNSSGNQDVWYAGTDDNGLTWTNPAPQQIAGANTTYNEIGATICAGDMYLLSGRSEIAIFLYKCTWDEESKTASNCNLLDERINNESLGDIISINCNPSETTLIATTTMDTSHDAVYVSQVGSGTWNYATNCNDAANITQGAWATDTELILGRWNASNPADLLIAPFNGTDCTAIPHDINSDIGYQLNTTTADEIGGAVVGDLFFYNTNSGTMMARIVPDGTGGTGGTAGTGGTETGGTETGGTETGGSETGGAETGGTETGGSETGGTATGGTETGGTGTGGTETGGSETGGTATGGNSTGGTETGGTATGGNSTGGTETGGTATGGNSTGGTETGGNSTGGTETGGNSTGGTETGGNSTGGTETGGTATGGNSTGGTETGGNSTGGLEATGGNGTGGATVAEECFATVTSGASRVTIENCDEDSLTAEISGNSALRLDTGVTIQFINDSTGTLTVTYPNYATFSDGLQYRIVENTSGDKLISYQYGETTGYEGTETESTLPESLNPNLARGIFDVVAYKVTAGQVRKYLGECVDASTISLADCDPQEFTVEGSTVSGRIPSGTTIYKQLATGEVSEDPTAFEEIPAVEGDNKDGGCNCSTVQNQTSNNINGLLLSAGIVLAGLRKRSRKGKK